MFVFQDESDPAGGESASERSGGAAAAAAAPADQSCAQVASLASSVVLDLNESQPSLVNQSDGGDKVRPNHSWYRGYSE